MTERYTGTEKLSSVERDRMVAIIAAAEAADWPRFSSLSDRPFSNHDAMREQFRDSSELLQAMGGRFDLNVDVKIHDDGSRLIFSKISFEEKNQNPISLILHSEPADEKSTISIWTFFQEVSFS